MSKKKTKSNRQKKQQGKESQTKRSSTILPLLLAVCTLVGCAASLVAFFPRPTVSPPSIPFDKNDRFSVSFDITNGGYVPLEDCEVSLGVGQIATKGARLDPSFLPTFKSRLVMPAWQHHTLRMDEKFTVVLSDLIRGNVESADIALIVSYKPWFLPIYREKAFRFVTFKQPDGQSYWRSWPIQEPLPPIRQ
jgi:hypothetical protein